MRVLAAQINPTIGDLEGNTKKILEALRRSQDLKMDLVLFPELTLSGYPPEDLLLDASFIHAVQEQLKKITEATKGLLALVGLPRWNPSGKEKPLYNSAAVLCDGKLLGFHDKQLLPTYDVFDERRFFEPGKAPFVIPFMGKRVAVTICEDLWQYSGRVGYTHYEVDPVSQLQEQEIDLILNLSASPYSYLREQERLTVFVQAARAVQAPLILCNQVGANDQLVFDGHSMYLNAQGELLQMAQGFVEEDLFIDLSVFASPQIAPLSTIGSLYQALVLGVRDYFFKQGLRKAIIGLSGGIDSAVTACIAVEALGAKSLHAFQLPSRFSSPSSYADARLLSERIQIQLQKIEIEPLFEATLNLLEPKFEDRPWDFTEENMQARIRCQILMSFSNKFGNILLNTSNKSEMAMGYSTLYGDMAGGLGVLQDVTKSRVYELAHWINRERAIIPEAILQKAPSPELREGHLTQDTLPPFDLLDPVLEDYLEERLPPEEISKKRRISLKVILEIITKVHGAEYKRRQAPIGIRVTQKAFSKGRTMPIVQRWR